MNSILYTSHSCPFCARAVSALKYAGLNIELRSSDFKQMPENARAIFSNASIPLLVHQDNSFIDESWDIVKWAIAQNDPENWLGKDQQYLQEAEMLIETYDHSFFLDLNAYKAAPEAATTREACEEYIEELEEMLNQHQFLLADHITIADISIVAFIRLFALHEPQWFTTAPYPKCRQWLDKLTSTPYFKSALNPYKIWHPGDAAIFL